MMNEIFYNQYDLLRAIFNTDKKEDSKILICVYDLKNDEKLVAIFCKAKDCANYLGITENYVRHALCREETIKKRYKIVRIYNRQDYYE